MTFFLFPLVPSFHFRDLTPLLVFFSISSSLLALISFFAGVV